MKDQIETSEAEFQRAIDLDPTLAEAHYSLGIAHWQLGDFPGAIKELKAAIAARADYAEAHYMFGDHSEAKRRSGCGDSGVEGSDTGWNRPRQGR